MSSLGLGEAAGEFTDVTGADQLARGGVTAPVGGGAPPEIMPGTGSSRSLPAG
jgi:hypothetical protein